ncbi:MAG: LacI family DNA-binding transcriptional regulator [Turicibacter sp.]
MVGIKDIAKRAGVSISTVSNALNGNPKVIEETRKRIEAIADEMNYVPNMAGRVLKKKETKIIGLFLPNYAGDTYYGQLIEGIAKKLYEHGYALIICSWGTSQQIIPERMIDAAIILDYKFKSEDIITYANKGHKIVVLDRMIAHENVKQVLINNKYGVIEAINYIKDCGYKDICVLTGPEENIDACERLNAVLELLEDEEDINLSLLKGSFSKDSGERLAKIIVDHWKNPVAVFALNDEMAIGVYTYIKKTEFVIGRDINIMGFDHIEIGEYLNPKLTSVSYSRLTWGEEAAKSVLALLGDVEVEDKRISTELFMGYSIGKI